jgi:hypothetical protein
VTVSYLARGITWAPSYLIDLSDPKTARLTAKALVINEVADLEGAHLDLVTGFPNIRHADISSPVAMSLSLAEFLNALERGRDETGEPHGFVGRQQVLAVRSDGEPEIGNVPQIYEPGTGAAPYSTARAGAEAEDLFLYPVEGFSLRRGETAYLPLFTAEVPYEHIYVWKIPDLLGREERLHEEERRLGRRFAEEVWHSSRLSNTMKLPWTTAPAQFVTGGQIVGQDLCFYTAPGAKSTIRVNRAINLFAEQSEVEVERKPEAASFHGVRYDLVKLKGELKLRNRLGKPATVEVTKELSGEVRETTPKATDTATAKGLKRVNPRHTLVWRICTGSA